MADVFISYASEDREGVRRLASALEGRGWSVWWDRKIIAGQTFDQVIERELDNAKSVVVLWSKNSVVSEWVKNEAAAAAERGVLVPALIDRVKLPLEFRRKQTVDLVGWDGHPSHGGFQTLCDGLTAAITGAVPSQSPTPPRAGLRWNRRWAWSALVGVAVALTLGAYLVIQRLPSDNQARSKPGETTGVRPVHNVRSDILHRLASDQQKALDALMARRVGEAINLTDKNLAEIDKNLGIFPNDADFYSLKGYALKNMYQHSKGLLPIEKRREYLADARKSFEQALRLDPKNAGAHNGMGNVLFFEGKFDDAIREHDKALELTNGNYPYAEQDKQLVMRVKRGEIPFDF